MKGAHGDRQRAQENAWLGGFLLIVCFFMATEKSTLRINYEIVMPHNEIQVI